MPIKNLYLLRVWEMLNIILHCSDWSMNKCISCSLSMRRCFGLVNPKFHSHTNSHLPPKLTGKATIHSILLLQKGLWMWAPPCPTLFSFPHTHTHTHTHTHEADAQRCVPSVKCPSLHKNGDLGSPWPLLGGETFGSWCERSSMTFQHHMLWHSQTHEKRQLEHETVTLSNTFCPIETP